METYSFDYERTQRTNLAQADRDLCDRADRATQGSYSPYSQYSVGAALRLSNGQMVAGANQENASYPCGTCAERTALNYAQATWPSEAVEAIAIAASQADGSDGQPPYPCGLCRQALAEVEHRQGSPIRLLLVGKSDVLVFPSVACLLPFAFGN